MVPSWFKPGQMATFVTDKSRGFADANLYGQGQPGPLYVRGAETTVTKTQRFLQAVDEMVMFHLPHADTHFKAEYAQSHEAKIFPEHQIFGTPEWEYMLDFNGMQAPVRWIFKNVFNVGGESRDSGVVLQSVFHRITDHIERKFFANLFYIGVGDPKDPSTMEFGEHRDKFMQSQLEAGLKVSLHMGDAYDYCLRDAVKYALSLSGIEHAVILEDLSHGIFNPNIDPTGVWSRSELIQTDPVLAEALQNGRLVLIRSDEFLRWAKN